MKYEMAQLLATEHRPRILVVGDVMLDRYVWGNVDRISYESPVPVLRMDRTEDRLGGAGSVVALLRALEVQVCLAAVVGDDSAGRSVAALLDEQQVRADTIVVDPSRQTTLKERLLGRTQSRHPQQMVRVDCEDTAPISDELADRLLEQLRTELKSADVVLVSDYNKGVCSTRLIAALVSAARDVGVRVIVDPTRGVDFRRYAGCTAITPNRAEAGLALGRDLLAPKDGIAAARELLSLGLQSVLVTLDRDGIAWADETGRSDVFPVVQRQVYDVTGAGDAVLSALGYALAVGADWPAATQLANLAGGLEVQQLGVATFDRYDLLTALNHENRATASRIVAVDQLLAQLSSLRQRGLRIVMANGCYDLLHPGHVDSLQFARRQGDCLVVGLNSDESVRQLKGAGRPIVDQAGRAEMLASLSCVDYVVVFDETSVAPLVESLRPDVLVKSAEYGIEQVVGHEVVQQYGGQVVLAPMTSRYSTSELIRRIREVDETRRG